MAQFELIKNEMATAGAQVVFVVAQKRHGFFKPVEFLRKHPISFPFLLDEDRSVTKAYGLHNRFSRDAWNVAHPATLVIDGSGMVRYIYRGVNQTDRAPLEQVLEAAKKIGE